MTHDQHFDRLFAELPLIAILRGIRPDECVAAGRVLIDAGIRLIEVPLNSPDPLASIRLLVDAFGLEAAIGAGTVLTTGQVDSLVEIGAGMVISPNFNPEVVAASRRAGLVSLPGVATPSEAFSALAAGASGLKLFPAEGSSPAELRAWRAVIASDVRVLPVGGVSADTMAQWMAAGASGFGLGSALYKAGMPIAELARNAAMLAAAFRP